MSQFDEKILIEESKKNFEEFLKKEKRSLVTFTKDSNLIYMPNSNIDKFILNPKKGVLNIPLTSFLDRDLNNVEILWHIYYELALYPDWKKNPEKYLYRDELWKEEIEKISLYILSKIKTLNLQDDPAYKSKIIKNYVKKEILDFLYLIDKYTAFLRVLQLNPMYEYEENNKYILEYMKENKKTLNSIENMQRHRAFSNSFLLIELYKEIPNFNLEENPFNIKIFNEDLFYFVRRNLILEINKGEGILKRDEFVKSFVYPVFEKLFIDEIDNMEFVESKSKSMEKSKGEKSPLEASKDDDMPDSFESTKEEVDDILKEMLEEKESLDIASEDIVQGKVDLKDYGVSNSEEELFNYYAIKMKKQRDEMKLFWRKLVGNAKKEENVKKTEEQKGKLHVDSLIKHYPDFVEAEKKGNYKDLPIFSRYLLEPKAKVLPEKIEISFLIDNSGSMNESKIEAARKAVAVTLLSLDDFNDYLEKNTEKLNQKVEVLSETWFFGSKYNNLKKFQYKNNKNREKSDIIKSITKIDGSYGATDDASCLREIADNITSYEESRLKRGQDIKILFEITDGASSFPGLAKNAVEDLMEKNVKVFAFQIGKNSDKNEELFNYVWNENFKEKHGIIIGEDVEKLPQELLNSIGNNLENIFTK